MGDIVFRSANKHSMPKVHYMSTSLSFSDCVKNSLLNGILRSKKHSRIHISLQVHSQPSRHDELHQRGHFWRKKRGWAVILVVLEALHNVQASFEKVKCTSAFGCSLMLLRGQYAITLGYLQRPHCVQALLSDRMTYLVHQVYNEEVGHHCA